MKITDTVHELIERRSDVLGGVPIIRGTRIPVSTLVAMVKLSDDIEEVVSGYPSAGRAGVEAALAYCAAYPNDIDALIAESQALNDPHQPAGARESVSS